MNQFAPSRPIRYSNAVLAAWLFAALSTAASAQAPAPPSSAAPKQTEPASGPNAPVPSSRAAATAPRLVLLTSDGKAEGISLLALRSAAPPTFSYLSSTGEFKTRPLQDAIALAPANWLSLDRDLGVLLLPDAARSRHRLILTDGQTIIGGLSTAPSGDRKDKDALVHMRHDRIGRMSFPIDLVQEFDATAGRSIPDKLAAQPTDAASKDTVFLANGDVLQGLVVDLGTEIAIEIEPPTPPKPGTPRVAAPPTSIALDSVLSVRLQNPPASPTGPRLYLLDGSIITADQLTLDAASGQITLIPLLAKGSSPAPIPLSELVAVVPDAARFIPLARQPIIAQSLPQGRLPGPRVIVDAPSLSPLSASDIQIPGPMSVEFALPSGNLRLSGNLQLDERAMSWGTCSVRISLLPLSDKAAPKMLADVALSAGSPLSPVNIELGLVEPETRLKVEVLEGPRGPIQARVVLHRMVLTSTPAQKPGTTAPPSPSPAAAPATSPASGKR